MNFTGFLPRARDHILRTVTICDAICTEGGERGTGAAPLTATQTSRALDSESPCTRGGRRVLRGLRSNSGESWYCPARPGPFAKPCYQPQPFLHFLQETALRGPGLPWHRDANTVPNRAGPATNLRDQTRQTGEKSTARAGRLNANKGSAGPGSRRRGRGGAGLE